MRVRRALRCGIRHNQTAAGDTHTLPGETCLVGTPDGVLPPADLNEHHPERGVRAWLIVWGHWLVVSSLLANIRPKPGSSSSRSASSAVSAAFCFKLLRLPPRADSSSTATVWLRRRTSRLPACATDPHQGRRPGSRRRLSRQFTSFHSPGYLLNTELSQAVPFEGTAILNTDSMEGRVAVLVGRQGRLVCLARERCCLPSLPWHALASSPLLLLDALNWRCPSSR
jgi:hypothetical protein